MSQLALANPLNATRAPVFSTARVFAIVTLALMAAAALLAGWAPLGFSIVTVFLFAGPHNWIELRYFMARLPGRLGPLRGFFIVAAARACNARFSASWSGGRAGRCPSSAVVSTSAS